jgi:hypothetical protein
VGEKDINRCYKLARAVSHGLFRKW